ncbi:MAG: Flp family type IVb pilin [Candidatus Wallbacteria bacterium HGW-Wallbacteria-1]|uniref:Flp family type IVb pilin n=1 Tax=Candidatus Wallbacteria bacterium HGW-Wallbacteria-1 TaxID=2013854 RepID=A0A2N1PQ57_9BACT|nr:MAG: Flp family type IVb pilin [Candidatus Wallbacteria bacterium HGW-Wallbacteria-1]
MRLIREESGQGMVEYGLILGLIAIVAIAALTATGGSVKSIFGTISGAVSSADGTART